MRGRPAPLWWHGGGARSRSGRRSLTLTQRGARLATGVVVRGDTARTQSGTPMALVAELAGLAGA